MVGVDVENGFDLTFVFVLEDRLSLRVVEDGRTTGHRNEHLILRLTEVIPGTVSIVLWTRRTATSQLKQHARSGQL